MPFQITLLWSSPQDNGLRVDESCVLERYLSPMEERTHRHRIHCVKYEKSGFSPTTGATYRGFGK